MPLMGANDIFQHLIHVVRAAIGQFSLGQRPDPFVVVWAPTLVFADESGFQLIPNVVLVGFARSAPIASLLPGATGQNLYQSGKVQNSDFLKRNHGED
jgi:hypothetical protein